MQIDIKDLAITLALGAFFFFGIELIAINFFGRTISSVFLVKLNENISPYVVGAVIATLCFVFGMVIEDISNKFVDSDTWLQEEILGLRILESDEKLKLVTFYNNDPPNFFKSEFVNKAVNHRLFGTHCLTEGKIIESYVRQFDGNIHRQEIYQQKVIYPSDEVLKKVSRRFYYTAKNDVYRDGNYYDELKKIQQRIDFSRAMVGVSAFLLVTVFIFGIFKKAFVWTTDFMENRIKNFEVNKNETETKRQRIEFFRLGWSSGFFFFFSRRTSKKPFHSFFSKKIIKFRHFLLLSPEINIMRILLASVILLFIFFLARFAYAFEEIEYNKRVYGYFLSLEIDKTELEKNKKP